MIYFTPTEVYGKHETTVGTQTQGLSRYGVILVLKTTHGQRGEVLNTVRLENVLD